MRTTVRLPDGLLNRARAEARRRGTTLTALLQEGLELALRSDRKPARKVTLPVSSVGGGLVPGVNLDNNAELLDYLEADLPLHKRR